MFRYGLIAAAAVALAACGGERKNEIADAPPQNQDGAGFAGYGAPGGEAQQAGAMNAPPPGGSTLAPAAPLPPGVVQVSRIDIPDPSGFERPMTAASTFIPAGWRSEGGVVWSPLGQCGGDYALRWRAMAPDGSESIETFPVPSWSAVRTSLPIDQKTSCTAAQWRTAKEFLEAAAQQMFQGARLLDYRQRPDEAKPFQDMIAQFGSMNTELMQSTMNVDAGELLVAYQDNGRDMRAVISAQVFITEARFADVMNPSQTSMEALNGLPLNFTIVRAPNGRLDFGLRKRVASSTRYNPEWSARIAEFERRKSKQQMDASAAAHAARMDAIREQGKLINGMYEERQIASDRNQREFIESIRGVETYHDPVSGSPVQLDNTYSHAWRVAGQDNTYILSNDPNFDPNRHNIEARQLQAIQ